MSFWTRLSNGFDIGRSSLDVLRTNKRLIIFPVLSGLAIVLIVGSFFMSLFAASGWDVDNMKIFNNRGTYYVVLLAFYVVNYFIVTFFNMALIHCARLYYQGREVTVGQGISFAASRMGAIFSWALFAATIGTVLRVIQDNVGWLGKILIGLLGFAWSIATFFVVPIIAYEDVGPIEALRKSAGIMKEKWGENIGAGFTFAGMQLIALVGLAIPAIIVGVVIHPLAGVAVLVLGIFLLAAIMSALRTIFIAAVYNNLQGIENNHFDARLFDDLFQRK